jgi:hypothetical protein
MMFYIPMNSARLRVAFVFRAGEGKDVPCTKRIARNINLNLLVEKTVLLICRMCQISGSGQHEAGVEEVKEELDRQTRTQLRVDPLGLWIQGQPCLRDCHVFLLRASRERPPLI